MEKPELKDTKKTAMDILTSPLAAETLQRAATTSDQFTRVEWENILALAGALLIRADIAMVEEDALRKDAGVFLCAAALRKLTPIIDELGYLLDSNGEMSK